MGLKRLVKSLTGGARPAKAPAASHHHHHPKFSKEELRAKTEEFNRNAERHWQEVASEPSGRDHALNKPFSTVLDTPDLLYRLGLALAELHLGVGHTVLDFGAGSGWLSSCLNRLRCRTAAIDVSPTALGLAQDLFRLDPRHNMALEPRFLPYDGHRIPLPDESVDRVISFDALHHVPNVDEVLAELFRVLKTGGRAVFAEPGEEHSHSGLAVYEMERCGILENDLHLDELIETARGIGFTDVLVKPYPDVSLTWKAGDYLRFMAGDDAVFPIAAVREQLRSFLVFTMAKGQEVRDSRNPGVLRAEISVEPEAALPLRGRAGALVPVPVLVKNAGDTVWLHEEHPAGGYVSLGGHLLDEAGQLLVRNHVRASLPRRMGPGEIVRLVFNLPLPRRPGRYRLKLDLVDDWVAWFEQLNSPTTEIDVHVDGYVDTQEPHVLGAVIEAVAPAHPLTALPGAPLRCFLRVTNTGDTLWLADGPAAVRLGGQLCREDGPVIDRDFLRARLPKDVAPDESAEAVATFAAPPEPGRYRLVFDLMIEGRCWFEQFGSRRASQELVVTEGMPDSRQPGLLRAEITLLSADASLVGIPSTPVSVQVRVHNTGNTLWLHETDRAVGHVALGGHLHDADGGLLELDLFRSRLPRSLPPGDSLDLMATFRAPETPGRYVVEVDLVDEGIAWFGQRGSTTVKRDLRVG